MKHIANIIVFILVQTMFIIAPIEKVLGQCKITASASPSEIFCGQSATLTAFGIGEGTVMLSENFNSGIGSGWSSTPGAVNFSNPCSPSGVDGTPHAWMDNNTSVPRQLVSATYDLTMATAGVTICFDLKFAKQGDPAPCEGPDEPDEGVYIQYSTNGGATWNTIHYFNPKGGKKTELINWNNWCFQVPPEAITSNTSFRWFQDNDSGKDYDHWGIDNVQIVQNDVNAEVVWGTPSDGYYHSYGVGSSGGEHPNNVSPLTTTTYNVKITTGTGEVCSTTVTLVVKDPIFEVDISSDPNPLCLGNCGDLVGSAVQVLDPGGIKEFENKEVKALTGLPNSLSDLLTMLLPPLPCTKFSGCSCPCGGSVNFAQTCPCPPQTIFPASMSMNINAEPLNALTVSDGELLNVCIEDALLLSGNFVDFDISLICPDGTSILLANIGDITTSQLKNVCFSMSATDFVSSGSGNYNGTWLPIDDFSLLAGCNPNGVWKIKFSATFDWSNGAPSGLPIGGVDGWSFTFDDPPILDTITNGVWSPNNGFSDPTSVLTEFCPTQLGNITHTLTVSNGVEGCATHTETIEFTVNSCTDECIPPTLNIDDLSVCEPNTINLSNAVSGNSQNANLTYYSNENDAQNATNPLATSEVSETGTYWIRAETTTDNTCFNVFPISVTIFPIPTPTISGNLSYCGINGTTLNAGDGYSSYLWSNGETTQIIQTTSIANLSVQVTDTNGCVGNSNSINILESDANEHHFIYLICMGYSVVVHGDTISTPGVYSATFPSDGECDSIAIAVVEFQDILMCPDSIPDGISSNFEIPNVFTPNNDGTNDFFTFNTENIDKLELRILNRWGSIVFETDKVSFSWDGKDKKGDLVTEGVYFYLYTLVTKESVEQSGHGFVTVKY